MPACSVDLYPQQVRCCIWRKEVRCIAGEESQLTQSYRGIGLIKDSSVDIEMSHLLCQGLSCLEYLFVYQIVYCYL
jgi:hypothetical protein